MATYYGASEMQSDSLQTLYLMNPGYVGYSDPQAPVAGAATNMVLLNSVGNSLNTAHLQHPSQQNQHFFGIPLQTPPPPAAANEPCRSPVRNQHEISAVHGFSTPRVAYNIWTSMDAAAVVATSSPHQISTTSGGGGNRAINDMVSQLGPRRSIFGPQPPPQAAASQQGLSLSLSPQQPAYGAYRQEPDVSAPSISPTSGDEMRISGSSSSVSAVSAGISGLQSVLMGSKYLKAAQQLLDEVVNVGKGLKNEMNKGTEGQMKANRDFPVRDSSAGGDSNSKLPTELSTAERQELQMKKAKLVSMLDEVEQRYRQYHHQMQILVSTFEAAAGVRSARTYTALALQTISRQFRCLKDAISGQIRVASRSLGEEENLGKGEGEGSRLRLVDHHLRQQRTLQQLGMMHHSAWRPQRGLPEQSVCVLRAWLFEHFLHPYPKDSDKHMLAKQTGLTRSQVSNWFINARVRLWKPMVEEMYLEEIKEQEQNGSEDKTNKSETNEELGSKSAPTQEKSAVKSEEMEKIRANADIVNDPKAPQSFIPNSPITAVNIGTAFAQANFYDNEQMLQVGSKKARTNHLQNSSSVASIEAELKPNETSEKELYMKFGGSHERPSRDGYSLISNNAGQGVGFGGYPIGEIGRFDPEQFAPRFSNGVSLTLGLPHCENLSLSGTQQTYLSNKNIHLGRRLELGDEASDFCSMNTPSNAYESINVQNRKRFASQLLPDFVA